MASLGLPFQGSIWYFIESSYGDLGLYTGAAALTDTVGYCVSSKVQNVRLGTGDVHEEIRGIGSPCVCELHKLASDYTLHLEYFTQCTDRLTREVINRWGFSATATALPSDCTFNSLAFAIGTNRCVTDKGTDGTCYFAAGCMPKTVNLAGTFNNLYLVTIDFSVKSVYTDGDYHAAHDAYPTDSGDMVGIAPRCLTDTTWMGAFLGFNCAGSIQKGGADVAYVVDAINITFDYDLQDVWDHDSMEKQYAFNGEISATGTIDISLNEGGGAHWAEVINQDSWNLVIDLGGTDCPRITLPGCEWKSTEIELDVSGEPMMHSVPFTCHPGDACTDGFWSTTP